MDGPSPAVYRSVRLNGEPWKLLCVANSAWTFSAIFAPQNQPRVEAAVREELQRALAEGFTSAELERARTGLLNERRLALAQDAFVASVLAAQLEQSRDFLLRQRVDEAIARVSLEEVNAAFRRHIDPTRLVTAWGGDFKGAIR